MLIFKKYKKIILIVLSIIMVLSLASCNTEKNSVEFPQNIVNDKYTVTCENGAYYLQLKNEIQTDETESNNGVRVNFGISFENMEEFVNDVKNGNFDEHELRVMNGFKKENDKIVMCDMNNLYYPIIEHPDIEFVVIWHGHYYTNSKSREEGDFSLSIKEINVDEYNDGVSCQHLEQLNDPYLVQDEVREDGHRILIHTKEDRSQKNECYTLSTDDRTYYVHKQYWLDTPSFIRDTFASETIPYIVKIYWQDDGHYFMADMRNGIDDFTDEHIMSLRMQKYVITEETAE